MKKIVIIFICIPVIAFSQLQTAKIFASNMVLQRDKQIHIWGKGIPEKTVVASFSGEQKMTLINADSSWDIYFRKQKANSNPQSISIISENKKIELQNILIGDIWLCIGQSNMEFPMKREMHFNDEIHEANQPLIKLYNPWFVGKYFGSEAFSASMNKKMNACDFYQGTWQNCDSISVKEMSAVGYYFAKSIVVNKKNPIGIINLAIGGAPIESFISKETLSNNKQFAEKLKANWLTNNALSVWARKRAKENIGDAIDLLSDDIGPNHAFKPCFAYEAGILPIIELPIKGVLLYQGESNAQEIDRVNEYVDLQKLMIDDYRKKWNDPTMPFYWVQLSSMDTLNYKSLFWPEFRNEQRKLLSVIHNSGMAVSSDVGFIHNVHPTNKKIVGERLARWALNKTYHTNIVPSGPLPFHAKYKNGKIVITFQYAGNDLHSSDAKLLRGFSIDGVNECKANINKKKVVIVVNEKPAFVYYGWKPFTEANLVNSALLPASTFKIKVN
ncbi:MAG: sialate O-acetylesterase [Bacteroidota bacterium]|nr:sialate O-acetylesterase [Bacteroidota bacterium]